MQRTIEQMIADFAKREREEAAKAKETEENIVCIHPDSYIAKEIKYQTALLHEILAELRKRG